MTIHRLRPTASELPDVLSLSPAELHSVLRYWEPSLQPLAA